MRRWLNLGALAVLAGMARLGWLTAERALLSFALAASAGFLLQARSAGLEIASVPSGWGKGSTLPIWISPQPKSWIPAKRSFRCAAYFCVL